VQGEFESKAICAIFLETLLTFKSSGHSSKQ